LNKEDLQNQTNTEEGTQYGIASAIVETMWKEQRMFSNVVNLLVVADKKRY
jgi:hypothetical protein